MKRPTITNDVELKAARLEMDRMADCGCDGNCRCPMPVQYTYHRQAVEEYEREASRKVMTALRAYRDYHQFGDASGAWEDDQYHETATQVLAELIESIGWNKP